jgi:hypothetical protein
MEKHSLLPAPSAPSAPPRRYRPWRTLFLLCALLVVSWRYWADGGKDHPKITCPVQPQPLAPAATIKWTEARRERATKLFQEAVRIPTQSYDDNGEPGEDPRWEPFEEFKKWLEESFPLAWNSANVEIVNSGFGWKEWADKQSSVFLLRSRARTLSSSRSCS